VTELEVGQIPIEQIADATVVDYAMPGEPPLRTVIVDAQGNLFQRVRWTTLMGAGTFEHVEWTGVGERPSRWWRKRSRPTWPEILQRGPVTILWTPTDAMIKEERL
jgi:hypothetical protein